MDKNAITLGLRIGRILAGQRRKRVPVAYLYGPDMVKLPPLPELDRETYPYAVICTFNSSMHTLFVSSGLPYALVDEDGVEWLHFPGPYGDCQNSPKAYQWADLGYTDDDYTGYSPSDVVWCNFDLCYEDGTLVCAASEPVRSSWEYVIAILFDGDAVTTDDGNGIYASDKLTSDNAASFSTGNAYRINIDGVTTVEDIGGSFGSYYLGNPYLYSPDNYEDNGRSWCVRQAYSYSGKYYYYILYTRTGGTHKLKLESVRA